MCVSSVIKKASATVPLVLLISRVVEDPEKSGFKKFAFPRLYILPSLNYTWKTHRRKKKISPWL